jgi:hypothetical protein
MFYDKPPERRCLHRNDHRGDQLMSDQSELVLLVSIKEIVHDIVENHGAVDEVVLLWH